MRKKTLNVWNKVLFVMLVVSLAVSVVYVTLAYTDPAPKIIVQGNMYYTEAPGETGGFGGSTAATFTAANLVSDGDVTAGDDLTVGDDANITDVMQYSGIENDWIEGDCSDATTTLFAVSNPWGATAYLDRFMLIIDGATATSAGYITCGTTTIASLTSDPTDLLIDDYLLATSSTANLTNGLAGASRSVLSGFGAPGTNSEDIILWRSPEKVACYIDASGASSAATGFTEATNTFSCNYKIHSFK